MSKHMTRNQQKAMFAKRRKIGGKIYTFEGKTSTASKAYELKDYLREKGFNARTIRSSPPERDYLIYKRKK